MRNERFGRQSRRGEPCVRPPNARNFTGNNAISRGGRTQGSPLQAYSLENLLFFQLCTPLKYLHCASGVLNQHNQVRCKYLQHVKRGTSALKQRSSGSCYSHETIERNSSLAWQLSCSLPRPLRRSALAARPTAAKKAAAKTAVSKAVLGQAFEINLQQSVLIPAQQLKVTFERVVEDSRCPQDVDCFWAGQATVAVRLDKIGANAKTSKTLGTANLTVQGSRSAMPDSVGKIGPYWLQIIEVAPEKGPPKFPGHG